MKPHTTWSRGRLAHSILKSGPLQRRKQIKLAYRNALKKTTDSTQALQRIQIAEDFKFARFAEKLLGASHTRTKRMIRAFRNSTKRFGQADAMERYSTAKQVREARVHDLKGNWNVSFNADLITLNRVYYHPINLKRVITNYIKKTGIKTANVLELGGGVGLAGAELEQYFGDTINLTITGTRPLAQWQTYPNSNKISWKVSNFGKLNKLGPPNSVDILHANLVIDHALSPTKALLEAHRLLKKGGLLVFTAENPLLIPEKFEVVKKIIKPHPKNSSNKFYVFLLRKIH